MHDEIADPTLRCPTKEPRCSDEMGTTFEQRRRAMVAKEVKSKPSGTTITIKTMGSVKTKKIRWLWEQHIPLGKLTVFCGDPGGMKSMIAGDLAARGSVGTTMPDGSECSAFDTLMFVGEDDVDDTTAPRLIAAGGDVNHVHYVEGVPSADGTEMNEVALDEHIGLIRKWLKDNPAIRLVIIDPLSNYLGETNMIDEQLVRKKILTPLKRLAAETGVAIIGVMHLNKKVNLSAINRIGGAMGFVGVARMVWMFIGDSQDPGKRYMLKVKANITKTTKGQSFEVVEKPIDIEGEMVEQPVINWTGTTSQSVNQQLGNTGKSGESEGGTTSTGARGEKIRRPVRWLREFMADGVERSLADICRVGLLEHGFSRATLYSAKDEIELRALKQQAGWFKIFAREGERIEGQRGKPPMFWMLDKDSKPTENTVGF